MGKIYFDQYFAGEISYDQWADLDAGLWRGRTLEDVMNVVNATKLTPGAEETVQILKKYHIKTAILSGGLDVMAKEIGQRVGIDYVLTNILLHQNGIITGKVENLVAWGGKSKAILQIVNHFDIPLEKTAYVGDGRNDMTVFEVVGLSFAYNPEHEEVANAATIVIRENNLQAILPHIISEFQQ